MKKVQFENGTFGIRTYWLFGWHFKSRGKNNWKYGEDYFSRVCMMTESEVDKLIKECSMTYKIPYKIIEDKP